MKWINISIEVLLIFLVLFSPLIYGSITALPLTIVEFASFLLLYIFLFELCLQDNFSIVKIAYLPLSLFVGLIIFQLIPLPAGFLKVISPATFALYRDFRPGPNEFLTLSIYPDATVNLLLQLLSFFAVFFVALNYIDNEKKGRRVTFAIIFSGFLYAIFGLIRRFTVPSGGFSTFTNRDHFAAYIELILPLSIVYALIEPNKTRKIILIFAASVMGLALTLSLSRAGIICFSLSLIIFLALFWMKRPLKKGLIAVLGMLLVLSLFLAAIGTGSITKRLATLQDPLKAMSGRVEVLRDAPKLIADFPLLGTGLGTFIDIFSKYKTFESKTYRFAHNEPLQLIAETGISGFLLVFIFLILYFMRISGLWLKRRNPYAIYITLGCFIGLISVGMHSFFEFMLHVPAVTLLFFIILALMFRAIYTKDQQDALPVPQRNLTLNKPLNFILLGAISLLFFLAIMPVLYRYQAEVDFSRAASLSYQKEEQFKFINAAINANPQNCAYWAKKADLFSGSEEFLALAEKYYKRAMNLNPARAIYHFRLAEVYKNQGRLEETRQEFNKAVILDPQNKKIREFINQNVF